MGDYTDLRVIALMPVEDLLQVPMRGFEALDRDRARTRINWGYRAMCPTLSLVTLTYTAHSLALIFGTFIMDARIMAVMVRPSQQAPQSTSF